MVHQCSQGEVIQGAADLRKHPTPLAVETTLLVAIYLPPLARESFESPHLQQVLTFAIDMRRRKERRGGGGYSFFACLGGLTMDQVTLSRRSTTPTPNGDSSKIWGSLCFFHTVHENIGIILSPSCILFWGKSVAAIFTQTHPSTGVWNWIRRFFAVIYVRLKKCLRSVYYCSTLSAALRRSWRDYTCSLSFDHRLQITAMR